MQKYIVYKKGKDMKQKIIIYTIGHSTHSIEDFITILKKYEITELIDIRTIAKSRHNPQFNETELALTLRNHHIGYRHEKHLGGLRHAKKDSINLDGRMPHLEALLIICRLMNSHML